LFAVERCGLLASTVNWTHPTDASVDVESSDPESRAELSGSSASTRRLRIIFFGTPDFAVPSLERLTAELDFRVAAVVSQPDRAVGRHAAVEAPPVARLARVLGIPLLQPAGIRGAEFAAAIRERSPDVLVVVAYGKILPPELLELPRLGAVNVHGSLLPRHRGASPVQAAILAGDPVTGVATMQMTEGLDEGPVFAERQTPIENGDTAQTLSARLAGMGSDLLVETLRGIAGGTFTAKPQRGEPSYCRPIRREDGRIDWNQPGDEILRMRRAFTPWPGIFTSLEGETVKILEARPGPPDLAGVPGAIVAAGEGFAVVCGEGSSIEPLRLQRAGRKAAGAGDFRRGLRAGERELRFGP
jgi:methionyl-tRNA formyltransferase